MQSLYDFIVEPFGNTYENEIEIENVKIILNTNFSWLNYNKYRVYFLDKEWLL